MPRRNTEYYNYTYYDYQEYLYSIHQTLQNLTTRIGNIYSNLIRPSFKLLDTCPNKNNIQHTENFERAYRDLNTTIQQLANTNHNLGNYQHYLVPFNIAPSSPCSSASSLLESEPYSNLGDFPGGLANNQFEW